MTALLKFTFSEKATKFDKIFTVNLTVCSNRQINVEDFVNFCGFLRKHELYQKMRSEVITNYITHDKVGGTEVTSRACKWLHSAAKKYY